MRRFVLGLLLGAAYSLPLGLLMWWRVQLPSPLGTLAAVAAYGALGWVMAAGAQSPREGLSRALVAGLGCTVGAWLVSLAFLIPFLKGWASVALLIAGLLAELKFAAVAGLAGRLRGRKPAPVQVKSDP